jgi:hypothetical protein
VAGCGPEVGGSGEHEICGGDEYRQTAYQADLKRGATFTITTDHANWFKI